jgi:hypothetical protein
MVGHCQHNHYFGKELICNREWCSSCGGDGGKAHLRRIADKLPKARQIATMGKFTITVPPEIRHLYRTPEALTLLAIALKRMFIRYGFARGIRRFHFFGEDHPGSGLQGAGFPVYHPHMEAIIESGFLSPEMLYRVRRSVARILHVDQSRVVLHYQYSESRDKMLHMVRYMLRPTFERYEWDAKLALALKGFRNAVCWGRWHERVWDRERGKWLNGELLPPAWDMPPSTGAMSDVPEALQHGSCPHDGSMITWGETMAANLVQEPYWSQLGGGYWGYTGRPRPIPRARGPAGVDS